MSYEKTLLELNALEKQFQRMEVNRRQKVNSIKYKRTQRLHAEYKMKSKAQHSQEVEKRRLSLDSFKAKQKIENANKNGKRRELRRKTIEIHSNHKIKDHKRESVLLRKQQLQQQEQQRKKEEFLLKQRKREQKIARVMKRKKKSSSHAITARSASNSFIINDETSNNDNKENMNRSFPFFEENLDVDSMDSSIISSTFGKKQKLKIRACSSTKSLNHKKKKKKSNRFMKPTLSAYLQTNQISTMLASC